jgi:polar amino acid transport system substrate-binding protein
LSEPYYVYGETLTVRVGADYRSVFDLVGKRVGTLNQTYAWDMLKAIGNDPIPYEGNEEPYLDLEQGRLDAVLLDNIIADRYGCVRKTLYCVPYDQARGTYVIGMRKGDAELKAAVDKALADMRADGELERILAKAKLWDDRQAQVIPVGGKVEKRAFDGYMFAQFAQAAVVTLEVSVLAFLLAVPLGLLLAIARVYGSPIVGGLARVHPSCFAARRCCCSCSSLLRLAIGRREARPRRPRSSGSVSTTPRTRRRSIAARCSRSRAARRRHRARSAWDRGRRCAT